jgi:hypothetical protein
VKAAATANRWRNIISSRQLVEAAATANRQVEELHKEQELVDSTMLSRNVM